MTGRYHHSAPRNADGTNSGERASRQGRITVHTSPKRQRVNPRLEPLRQRWRPVLPYKLEAQASEFPDRALPGEGAAGPPSLHELEVPARASQRFTRWRFELV